MRDVVEKCMKILATTGVVIGLGWCIWNAQPEIVETEKEGVIINYKNKLVVMLNGEYRRITDADLYVYAIDRINSKIKVNFDMEKESELVMDINGWYDDEGNYHKLDSEEE